MSRPLDSDQGRARELGQTPMRSTNVVRTLAFVALALTIGPHVSVARNARSGPTFVITKRSDEWVERSIRVQTSYARVLLVDASERPPNTIRVRRISLAERLRAEVGPER